MSPGEGQAVCFSLRVRGELTSHSLILGGREFPTLQRELESKTALSAMSQTTCVYSFGVRKLSQSLRERVTMWKSNASGPFDWPNFTKHTVNDKDACCFAAIGMFVFRDWVYGDVYLLVSCVFEMEFYFDDVHDSAWVCVICYAL